MKYIKLFVIASIVALASCEKAELENNTDPLLTKPSEAIQSSKWISPQNWSSNDLNYHTTLTDKSITPSIVNEGLVLVYTMQNDIPLPLNGQLDQATWLYQVEEGSIEVSATVKEKKPFIHDQLFSYIIISKEQLMQLEENGFSKLQLMEMSYEQLSGLIK
jgi:hypothetical protein